MLLPELAEETVAEWMLLLGEAEGEDTLQRLWLSKAEMEREKQLEDGEMEHEEEVVVTSCRFLRIRWQNEWRD